MRLTGQEKMGFFATPPRITDLIRERLDTTGRPFAALDPCAGEGEALAQTTAGMDAMTYGIEPDSGRVAQAREALNHVLHCTLDEARLAHQSFGLLWLNPPYDQEYITQEEQEETGRKTTRKERIFLNRCLPLLAPGGVFIFIVPAHILDAETRLYLSERLDNLECWHFPEPERQQFKQAIAIGTKRPARLDSAPVTPLTDAEDQDPDRPRHTIPWTAAEVKIFRTVRLSAEDLAAASASSNLWNLVRPNPPDHDQAERRSPMELHAGHLSLLLAAGCLDGIVGEGADRHLVKGKTKKDKSKTTETTVSESGSHVTTTKHRDRYAVALKILRPTGEILELT